MSDRTCSVDGCENATRTRSGKFCDKHYARWRRRGTTDPGVNAFGPPSERVWRYVDRTDTCWLWTGALNQAGYGRFFTGDDGKRLAHRFMYELLVGPIPEGLTLDHLCRTPACVRPDHLEPVTRSENARRAGANKTHCRRGHLFVEANTSWYRGKRQCKTCSNEQRRIRYRRQKEVAPAP